MSNSPQLARPTAAETAAVAAPAPSSGAPGDGPRTPVRGHPHRDRAGRAFSTAATVAGSTILVTLAAVAVFLVLRAWPALSASPEELTEGIQWFPEGTTLLGFVGPMLFGTVLASVIALAVAVPVSTGIALFISHYAPRRMANALGYLIDLLAAIPSVVYGLWGVAWLAPRLQPAWAWLSETLGFIPLFEGPAANPPRVILTVGIVLAVMILPIITAVAREVFLQTPRLHEEAALALGATRWEMIKMAVFPFARPGIIAAVMLGLGRALGETMAVTMILSGSRNITFEVLTSQNPNTIAATIAQNFPEAFGLKTNQLIAAGLVLFLITLVVNMIARWIVSRRAEYSGAN